jgi:CspA family cold shock protein
VRFNALDKVVLIWFFANRGANRAFASGPLTGYFVSRIQPLLDPSWKFSAARYPSRRLPWFSVIHVQESGFDKPEHELGKHLMIKGTVKFFNTTKGFGFITPDGGGKDAFVHISAVQRSGLQGLYENDKVEYELEQGRDGKEAAVNLKLLG